MGAAHAMRELFEEHHAGGCMGLIAYECKKCISFVVQGLLQYGILTFNQ